MTEPLFRELRFHECRDAARRRSVADPERHVGYHVG
jgi:hypothetical protein